MPPKKKLSKKEKARLEAEKAEMLRIEMEREKLKKLEEERQRKQIEREQAEKRQQQEIAENKMRRTQLKDTMAFFGEVQSTIDKIKQNDQEQRDWEQFMRCDALPSGNCPSDLRKYIHLWMSDIEKRNRCDRNWLLKTNERSLLTQDSNVADLSRNTLGKQQGNAGDVYARRLKEVLGVLAEVDDAIADDKIPANTLADLVRLKSEIRTFLNRFLDEFTYRTLSHVERDMEIDRPGVWKHAYSSDVFKSFVWAISGDAESSNQKTRIGDQNQQHTVVEFPIIELEISLPPTVKLQNSAVRGLWLNYDHLSDNCASYYLRIPQPKHMDTLLQTKKEWKKRKEILQSMLDESTRESPPVSILNDVTSEVLPSPIARTIDVDKLYTEFEDEQNKARRKAIGPDLAYNLSETDVNLRKYRIIGGVYSIDYLEQPQQDKRLNSRTFIRTNKLCHKDFRQSYKPPPPPLPGVRRLPEEIEAEMRMIEASLDKLALVTVQLSNSVLWFEPPIACRWETALETNECDNEEPVKLQSHAEAIPDMLRSSSGPPNTQSNSIKMPPRCLTKRRTNQNPTRTNAPISVRRIYDFDMLNIPSDIDIYGLLQDFVVPRLPHGFRIRKDVNNDDDTTSKPEKLTNFYFARDTNSNNKTNKTPPAMSNNSYRSITENLSDSESPRELYPYVNVRKQLEIKDKPQTEAVSAKDVTSTGKNIATQDDASVTGNCPYMFSQLLEDLNGICDLQTPHLEETLNQICSNLSQKSSISSSDAEALAQSTDPYQPAALTSYYSSGMKTVPVEANLKYPAGTNVLESSSEYDDDEDRDASVDGEDFYSEKDDKGARIAETVRDEKSITTIAPTTITRTTKGKWSTRDVHDTKFNEDKLSIQFRTGRLGIFGFALNRYSNMPYQTWEIKPDLKNPGVILFSFTASIISLDMTITSDGYCVNSFQGGTTDNLTEMIGKTLSLSALKSTLISSAVDIFPDEDAFCYTEGSCEKNYIMEMHLYACISTLGLSHNFSWSRWNLLAGSRTAVLLTRELIENKKVPNHSTLLATPLKTAIIDCTEVSASFNAAGIDGMDYYADLYQLAKAHAQPCSLEKQQTMNPVLRDNVAHILMSIRPLSFC